ncbi:MAG: polyprenyl synthetase family protein [Verrucomicrobia bacterium]|nr:polyprenyl synthetase family protein [Verrucomicrobiota bacterium]
MITQLDISIIEARLEELIASASIGNASLFEAVRYALLDGGKRLRPQMVLSLGGPHALDIACAIEMIHNYSLIHDDLPCLDNDLMRRGKPTLHRQFGEATALLAGDFLLTYAFEVIAKASLPSPLRVALTELFSRHSRAMVYGQALDIAAKGKELSWEAYEGIVFDKTSALFIAALEAGALIAALPPTEVQGWIHFGKLFGLLYQMKDDAEDNDGPLRKTLSDTNIEKMITLLTIHAKELLKSLQPPSQFFHTLL